MTRSRLAAQLRAVLVRRFRFLPPRAFAMLMHLAYQGEFSTLRRPRTFAELLAARNLEVPDPLVPRTADKYTVRAHVADRVGERYLVPLRQVVTHVDELGPLHPPCVLKATHGYDMTLLLPRDRPVETERVRATVARWLATDFHRAGWRESPYRGLTPRVVVEDFLGDGVTPPPDHKLYMFHGRLGLVQVDEGRFGRHTSALLDPGWNVLDVDQAVPRPDTAPTPPPAWAEMVAVAERLSADFPMARIDLYDIDGRVYFGEITHFPGGGVATYRPPAFNRAVGDLWRHGTPIPAAFRLS